MDHPGFFRMAGPFTLSQIVERTGADHAPDVDLSREIHAVKALDEAQPGDVSFLDNTKYLDEFADTRAGACFVAQKFADRTPENTIALVCKEPYRAFAATLQAFFPDAIKPPSLLAMEGERIGQIHPDARLEDGVTIDPGAVVGPGAQIGRGTHVSAGAVVGPAVHVGRDCSIGPNASLLNALIDDRVIIHAGVRIGQEGFGFAMGADGHMKVPQIGRVIIQDDVDIGANTTIDRGALKDTIIGEGTKIDNLVQIGHNVVIGRHCVIVAQCGISGSTELGDFAVLGGQVGVIGHAKIGSGAMVAACSGVAGDIPAGERWGGSPAQPSRTWMREVMLLRRLARQKPIREGD